MEIKVKIKIGNAELEGTASSQEERRQVIKELKFTIEDLKEKGLFVMGNDTPAPSSQKIEPKDRPASEKQIRFMKYHRIDFNDGISMEEAHRKIQEFNDSGKLKKTPEDAPKLKKEVDAAIAQDYPGSAKTSYKGPKTKIVQINDDDDVDLEELFGNPDLGDNDPCAQGPTVTRRIVG